VDRLPNPADPIFREAVGRASESDQNWFELNPGRLFRLRDVMPYEHIGPAEAPPDGMSWRTLVAPVGPGMRLRAVLCVPPELDNEDADDQQLASIFMPLAPKPLRKLLKAMLRKKRLN
jgi:hypothetical protein